MKLKLIGAALSIALLCTACGSATQAEPESALPTPAPTAESTVVSPTFKEAAQYDYKNYTESQGIDESGMFTGVRALDYVTLPENYKNLHATAADLAPSDDQMEWTIDTIVARTEPCANGDTVNIDYVGTVDGIEFVGGNTNGMGSELELGSGTYIPGFEEQVVGHKVGDRFDVTVTFPEGYADSTDGAGNPVVLSGKQAVFSVALNHINYAWPIDDAWVQKNLKDFEYPVSSVEDLKNYISVSLQDSHRELYVMDTLFETAVFGEVPPEPVLDYMVCRYLDAMNQYAVMANTSLEEFIGERGFASIDELLAYNEAAILSAVQSQMLLQAIAEDNALVLDPSVTANYEDFVAEFGAPYVNQYTLNRQAAMLVAAGLVVE